jgi:hypothetical protein
MSAVVKNERSTNKANTIRSHELPYVSSRWTYTSVQLLRIHQEVTVLAIQNLDFVRCDGFLPVVVAASFASICMDSKLDRGNQGKRTTMSSNKRKSGDVFSQSNRGPAVVVVNTAQPKDDAAIQAELQKLRQHQLSEDDPILMALENIDQGAYEPEEKLQKEASSVKSQLEQKLEQARDACQHESRVLIDVANRIESITGERTSLIQDMEKLDKQQIDLQRNISKYQEEASQEIESIDQVEEEQKRQVPRLKTQISLYASTTGIKWDFSYDHILSGQVVSCSLRKKSVLKMLVYSSSSSSSCNLCFLY